MNSIIEDLYYGRIDPSGGFVNRSDELKQKLEEGKKAERILRSKLDEEGLAALKTLQDAKQDDYSFYALHCYEKGFRHGARLMMDILSEEDEEP